MKKFLGQFTILVTLSALFLIAVLLLLPDTRSVLMVMLSGDEYYDNHSSSYWIEALRHDDAEVRRSAAFALGQMGESSPEAISSLSELLLTDKEDLVRLNASLALMKIGKPAGSACRALAEGLKDNVMFVRMNCAMALARIGPEAHEAVPHLVTAMQSASNRPRVPVFSRSVREQAAAALGKIGPAARSSVMALAELLEDSEPGMRGVAAMALGMIGADAKPAVPALLKALEDEDRRVREVAVTALGQIDPDALPR